MLIVHVVEYALSGHAFFVHVSTRWLLGSLCSLRRGQLILSGFILGCKQPNVIFPFFGRQDHFYMFSRPNTA